MGLLGSSLADARAASQGAAAGGILAAAARAQNDETLGKVIDESLKRSAELRKQREARQREIRAQERVEQQHAELSKQIETKAQQTAELDQQVAEAIARRAAEAKVRAESQQLPTQDRAGRGVDVAY